jgi:hypothetical protein
MPTSGKPATDLVYSIPRRSTAETVELAQNATKDCGILSMFRP